MAKRKRLSPLSAPPVGSTPPSTTGIRAPIANVAGEVAGTAAAQEMADALASARQEGRMILPLPLNTIDTDYLVRDRLGIDEEEMTTLMDSLEARGQQTPIDVIDRGDGRYALLSGWRRVTALTRLHARTNDARFATVNAVLRRPDSTAQAYLSMIEENEIRAGLSYYERARIVVAAVEKGVFSTEREALQTLFASASRAKRSKIGSFMTIVAGIGRHLSFPQALGERIGLRLAKALEADPDLVARLRADLAAHPSPDTAHEQARLLRALAPPAPVASKPAFARRDPVPGVTVTSHADGRVTLQGPRVDPVLVDRLSDWLKTAL